MTSNTQTTQQCVNVWTTGGKLEVAVGDGQYVSVPNASGQPPTREEIYQALVAAGHQARAGELANRAYGDVNGTEPDRSASRKDG